MKLIKHVLFTLVSFIAFNSLNAQSSVDAYSKDWFLKDPASQVYGI
ncbi:MAG: hypothetical protein RJB42_1155, partial [Bacteroidota bacterium]